MWCEAVNTATGLDGIIVPSHGSMSWSMGNTSLYGKLGNLWRNSSDKGPCEYQHKIGLMRKSLYVPWVL